MLTDKIRNLNPDEMRQHEREAGEQLFRLKFQMKMGQTAGLKKMRELRKDIARIKTVARERALGDDSNGASDPAESKAAAPKAAKRAAVPKKKSSSRKTAGK